MGCVAHQQQARLVPALQTVGGDRQQRHLLPILDLMHPISQRRIERGDRLAQRLDTSGLNLLVAALANDIAQLPLRATVQFHQHGPAAEAAHDPADLLGMFGDAQP